MANKRGKSGRSHRFYPLGLQNHCKLTAAMKLNMLAPWKKSYDKPRHVKKQTHYFANKGLYSQSYGFSSSNVCTWELGHNEGWELKNWCFWTVGLEKILERPLVSKEITPVNPKGNQPWIFIGRTDTEAEAPRLWSPDAKTWLTGKDHDAKNEGKRRRGSKGWDG